MHLSPSRGGGFVQKTTCPQVSPHHRQGCGLTCKPCCPRCKEHTKDLCWRGPAVPMRQNFRSDGGDPEHFLLCFVPHLPQDVLLTPSPCPHPTSRRGVRQARPRLQGFGSFFITQCRKVPQVWARICSMSPSSGSQSITRGGQGGFPKCDPSSQQCERNSERAAG